MNALQITFDGFHHILGLPVWGLLLLKITAILFAAWLGHLALARANPRWRVLLWRVTAVGLVVLPAVGWLFPALEIQVSQPEAMETAAVYPASETSPVDPAADSIISTGSAYSSTDHGFDLMPERSLDPNAANSLPMMSDTRTDVDAAKDTQPPLSSSPTLADSEAFSIAWATIFLSTWLAGIAVLGFRLCLGYYRITALARRGRLATQLVRDECLLVARAVGCRRRVKVVQSTDIGSPLLCGLRRPLLLLPARMCEDAYRDDLPGILAHELAHARSNDVPWNTALHLLSTVLWFHPLSWRMRKAHLAACELVSDAASADFVGDVADYCRTLARVAVDTCGGLPASGIAMARTSSIGRRLSALRQRVFNLPLRRRNVMAFGMVAFLGVGVLGALQFAMAAPEPSESATTEDKAESKTSEKKTKPVKDTASKSKTSSIRVLVLDPQGKPLPGAKVHLGIWTKNMDFKGKRDYLTDPKGIACVQLPPSYYIVRLWSGKKPFVTMFSHWEQNELASGTKIPPDYTVRLESAVTAGGRILDEQGKPITGARVQVSARGGKPAKADSRTAYNTWLATGSGDPRLGERVAAVTDADGRWQIDNVPDNAQTELSILVSHPDYISDKQWGQLQKEAEITTKMLLDKTATLTLRRGAGIQGRVTDPSGKPIKDAIVVLGDRPYDSRMPSKFPTDADGRFSLPVQQESKTSLTVIAPGLAPQYRKIEVKAGIPPQNFSMHPGKPVELRFIDSAGKPLSNVHAGITGWKGSKSLQTDHNPNHPKVPDTKIPSRSDKNGIWKWTSAPDDQVKLRASLKGFASRELEIAGGEPPQTITLKPEHSITGRVTDAATGKPIPAFTIIPIDVFRKDWLNAERMNAKPGKNGRLDYLATRTDIPLRLRIEAMGYRTQTGPEFRVGDDGRRTQDFRLQPSPPITGVVLGADGQAVQKAKVMLAVTSEDVSIDDRDLSNNHIAFTDDEGRFKFPDAGKPFTVVATTDAGFAMADFEAEQHDIGTLRLKPWASVGGQFFDGGRPVKDARFFLNLVRSRSLDKPRVDTQSYQIITDKDGRFEIPRVPPLPVHLSVSLGPWREASYRSGPSVPLDLKPGQKVELKLGQEGAVVSGQVKLTGKVPKDLDCNYSLNYLVSRTPGIEPPPSIAKFGFDIRKGWNKKWRKTKEGLAYMNTLRHWFVKLAPDGTFRASGVPAGEYDLAIEIYAKPSGCLVEPLAQKVVRVKVTEEDVARGKLELPEIEVKVVPVPMVGDTPSLDFRRPDGKSGSLADARGRYTLVHFWASWCAPCKQQLPTLRQLRKRFPADELAMLGLSLDEDAAVWQASLKKLNLPWQQGQLTAAADSGISSVPVYWLLNPAGKIVAKVYDPEKLAAEVDKAMGKSSEKKGETTSKEQLKSNKKANRASIEADRVFQTAM